MSKLNVTTYNTVAANTVADAVIDAPDILAWRQNVKDVVDANSPDGQYAADAGSTDAYAVTLSPVPAAYYTGMVVRFKANTANTGAATLNVNALGAKTIKKKVSSDLNDSDILASQIVEVVYDGTNFQLLSLISLKGEPWIAPTLLNSWSNFGGTFATACYRKDEVGNVLTKGYIGGGVTTGGTTIFTFPAGYRPNEQHRLTTHGYNGTTQVIVVLSVDNTGALNIIQGNAATQISLDITPFRAEQ